VREGSGWPEWLALNSSMALYVRGDSFDISSTNLAIRVVMGTEYYFKANEASIETSHAPSRNSPLNWIVVTGSRRGPGRDLLSWVTAGCSWVAAAVLASDHPSPPGG